MTVKERFKVESMLRTVIVSQNQVLLRALDCMNGVPV